MTHYHHVPSVVDVGVMTDAAVDSGKVWVDRLEATIESHTHCRQGARELHDPRHIGAYGMAVPRQAIDEGGAAFGRVPTAASRAAHTADEVYEFADAVGFR